MRLKSKVNPETLLSRLQGRRPSTAVDSNSDFAEQYIEARLQKKKTEDPTGRYLTVAEVAFILLKSQNAVRSYIGSGALPEVLRIGGSFLIPRSNVVSFLYACADN